MERQYKEECKESQVHSSSIGSPRWEKDQAPPDFEIAEKQVYINTIMKFRKWNIELTIN
jgi:hypothetical protein